jgi:hypothetical protein
MALWPIWFMAKTVSGRKILSSALLVFTERGSVTRSSLFCRGALRLTEPRSDIEHGGSFRLHAAARLLR